MMRHVKEQPSAPVPRVTDSQEKLRSSSGANGLRVTYSTVLGTQRGSTVTDEVRRYQAM